MNKYFFEPWVGDNYTKGLAGKKILALGDSHYCQYRDNGCEAECGNLNAVSRCLEKGFTTNVVIDFLEYEQGGGHKPSMNTYTKFAKLMNGVQSNSGEIIDFWQSIIFYNFVQRAMIKRERYLEKPSCQDYANGKEPFLNLLTKFQPDLIIVWGKRLWNQISKYGTFSETPVLDGKKGKLCYFKAGNKEIPAWCIYHPSAPSFRYDKENPYIQELLKLS